MKLYDAPASPNPFKARLFIAERGGLKHDVETIPARRIQPPSRRSVAAWCDPIQSLPSVKTARKQECSIAA